MRNLTIVVALGALAASCGGQTSNVSNLSIHDDAGLGGSPPSLADGGPIAPEGDAAAAPPDRRCTSNSDCRSGEICSEETLPVSVCRTACTPLPDGTGAECAAGEMCDGEVCRRLCHLYKDPSDCGQGDSCEAFPPALPFPMPGNPIPVPPAPPPGIGKCVAGNDLREGQVCQNGYGCGPNLQCVAGGSLFETLSAHYCAQPCETTDPRPNSGCAAGKCVQQLGAQGACIVDCDPFGAGSACPDGMACFPFDQVTAQPFARIVHGQCIAPGHLAEGQPCDSQSVGSETCGAGLVCSPLPAPFSGAAACRRFCNPDSSACLTGETCVPFNYSGYIGVGMCLTACTPWTSDPGASGCEKGDWCAPRFDTHDTPLCTHPGSTPAGGECVNDSECAAGSACRCQGSYDVAGYMNNCPDGGHCDPLCKPGATPGEPGSCPNGGVCFAYPNGTSLSDLSGVGFCRDACDYGSDVSCRRLDQICVPKEITGDTADSCFDTPMQGECDLNVCGALGLCLSMPDSYECSPVCRASVGTIGAANHLDCPSSSDTCAALPSTKAYGKCEAAP